MTNFQGSYRVPLFDKILPCDNFRQYNDGPLYIFRILSASPFSLLIIMLQCFTATEILKWTILSFAVF